VPFIADLCSRVVSIFVINREAFWMHSYCSQSSGAKRHSPLIPCPLTMNFGYFSIFGFKGMFPDIDPDVHLFARSRAGAASPPHNEIFVVRKTPQLSSWYDQPSPFSPAGQPKARE
jgi:hypothetical protein